MAASAGNSALTGLPTLKRHPLPGIYVLQDSGLLVTRSFSTDPDLNFELLRVRLHCLLQAHVVSDQSYSAAERLFNCTSSTYGPQSPEGNEDWKCQKVDPFSSPLAAAVFTGLGFLGLTIGCSVLFLGASRGTTVSFIADMIGPVRFLCLQTKTMPRFDVADSAGWASVCSGARRAVSCSTLEACAASVKHSPYLC